MNHVQILCPFLLLIASLSLGLAGRKCIVDFETVQLPEYINVKDELVDENGQIIYWRDNAVYNELSKKLGMKAKSIFQTVVRKYETIFGVPCGKPTAEFKVDQDESDHEDEVDIQISDEEKAKFEFIVDKHRHTVLKPGWTDTISEILLSGLDFPCVFSFEKHTVSMGDISTKANCECGTSLKLCSRSNLSQLNVKVLHVGTEIHSEKRRRLTGDRREYFAKKLENNNAYNVLNDEALQDEQKTYGRGQRIKTNPTKNALNILRCRQRNQNALHESTVSAIRLMKHLPEYDGDIKEFGSDPLHLIFWNKYQQFLYHQIRKKGKVCISIDATGSLISNQSLISDLKLKHTVTLPHAFLYLIMIKNGDSKSEPIGQFISADQHTRKIVYFLEVWKESFGTPNEITVDDSSALIKATIVAFTCCKTTDEYLERCQNILNGSGDNLECYIRLDVAHFVKNVVRNEVFKSMHPKLKQFYTCIIGLMMKCDSFYKIKEIVKHALIVATIPFESEDLPTLDSFQTLKKLIKTHDFSSVFTSIESSGTTDKLCDIESDRQVAVEWFDRIEEEVNELNENNPEETTSNIRDNFYMSLAFVPYFKNLCGRVPLWTSVMNSHFASDKITSSSADVEAQNNIIKNIIFNHVRLPTKLDTFMQVYLKSIKGSIYTAVSKQSVSTHSIEDSLNAYFSFQSNSNKICSISM